MKPLSLLISILVSLSLHSQDDILSKTTIPGAANFEAVIYKYPGNENEPAGKLKFHEELTVNDVDEEYFHIETSSSSGYVHQSKINVLDRYIPWIDAKRKQSHELKVTMLKRQYPKDYERILNGEVWLEMTKPMAKAAWGQPKNVYQTAVQGQMNEHWMYEGGNYLYFEGNTLKEIKQ